MKKITLEHVQSTVFVLIAVFVLSGLIFGRHISEFIFSNDRSEERTLQVEESPLEEQEIAILKENEKNLNNDSSTTSQSSKPNSSSSSPNSSQTPQYIPYVAGDCTKNVTPYKTKIEIATYLASSQTKVNGGENGYSEKCTADSNGKIREPVPLNPVDKIIYVGTGGITWSTPPYTGYLEDYQYDSILQVCSMQLEIHKNQEAYQLCVDILVRYWGV